MDDPDPESTEQNEDQERTKPTVLNNIACNVKTTVCDGIEKDK
jgi:hypothetical protein